MMNGKLLLTFESPFGQEKLIEKLRESIRSGGPVNLSSSGVMVEASSSAATSDRRAMESFTISVVQVIEGGKA